MNRLKNTYLKALIVALIMLPFIIQAQTNFGRLGIDEEAGLPEGLEIHTQAPLLSHVDIHGNVIDFSKILEEKSIVLIFYRGKWCPVCSSYLSEMNDSIYLIKDKNAIVIAVGPEKEEHALDTERKIGSNFLVIADTTQQIMKAYDVLFKVTEAYQKKIKIFLFANIAKNNGMDEAWLPVPATYIINQKGEIVFKQFEYNYKDRASVSEILKHL